MRSNLIESYKKGLKLSDMQREILVGILLGDANLETRDGGRTCRLKIEQSVNHRTYVEHLYEIYKAWVLTPPRIRKFKVRDKEYQNVVFSTVSHPAFRFYSHQFYKDGKKIVPCAIHKWLTPRNVAYWYMDDGSIKSRDSKGVIFNTQGFSHRDVVRLCGVLKCNLGVNAKLRSQREGWQIYVSGKSFEMMEEKIKPHIIESMLYKFPIPRRT